MKPKRLADRYIILILGALTSISPFAIDMYLPAFSEIAEDFETTPAKVSLSIASYFIGLAMGQIMYGPLLDRFGRKRPLAAGIFVFILASVGCMQSTSNEALVTFRFVQAMGGCVAWIGAWAMVRDYFPVEESSRVFSLLVLILGASPLLAPTIGGFITTSVGWPWIFIVLACIAAVTGAIALAFLPEGHRPDATISLRPGPMLKTFADIATTPQFYTYTLAGSLSFATLFIHVSGSPVMFMEIFKVSPQIYGGIFALLSVGFIGGSQVNILLLRYFPSDRIFKVALSCQVVFLLLFFLGSWYDLLGMPGTIAMLFASLGCIGVINPNSAALAIAPFSRNVGSASALLGSIQITIASLVSAAVGIMNSHTLVPLVALMLVTTLMSYAVLFLGSRNILKTVEAGPLAEGVGH